MLEGVYEDDLSWKWFLASPCGNSRAAAGEGLRAQRRLNPSADHLGRGRSGREFPAGLSRDKPGRSYIERREREPREPDAKQPQPGPPLRDGEKL